MIRKTILIFIFLIPLFTFSQSFKGGLTAGFIVSQVDGDDYGGYNKPGITFGGLINIDLKNKFSLGMELKYIQKGSADPENPEKGYNDSYKLRLSYIEIPVLVKYGFRKKIIFEGGLGFSYLIKASEETNHSGFEPAFPEYNQFEIPFVVGVGYIISEHFELSSRFSYSISSIREYPGGQSTWYDWGQSNKLISLSINYNF